MSNFTEKLKAFLHDPIDKCFDIPSHIERAKNYAAKFGVSRVEEAKGSDQIASCMERSLLPEGITQDFNEVRHPFSQGKISIESYKKEKIFEVIAKVYEKINKEISNLEDKKKFLFLWRNLQDKLSEDLKTEPWIKYLPLLPADTRVPDHSIWEHLKIASAINAYLDKTSNILFQNNSLFLFTIGPVQSFISQARKTQDFYMGSFILSFLTFKAMELFIEKYGPTNIIYPDLYKQPLMDLWLKNNGIDPTNFDENSIQLPTIPNRFVAILPDTDKIQITNLANEIKSRIIDIIEKAKNCIFKELNITITQDLENKIKSQLSEFPEIYWVAVPWKIDGKDVSFDNLKDYFEDEIIERYKNLWEFATKNGEFSPNIGLLYEILYSTLEKSIGARKNIRTFSQPNVAEKGRKCSVCGELDVIFFRETENKNKYKFNKVVNDLTENEKVWPKYLGEGEGLCSICFIKRTFDIYLEKKISQVFKDLFFPSTAEIACADFKEKVLNNAKDKFEAYKKEFLKIAKTLPHVKPVPKLSKIINYKDKENLEGSWFYEENLTVKRFKEQFGLEVSEKELRQLKNLLKTITDKVGKPNPYYAIIYLDGDNMGKWLSGELLPDLEYAYNSDVLERIRNFEVIIKDRERKEKAAFIEGLKKWAPKKLLTPAIHASISTALRNYTIEFVRKIVEEHLGKLVYAGGDDVLAFVNLKDLFEVMQKLRWTFSGHIKIENSKIKIDLNSNTGFVEKDGRYILTMGPQATASMEVVIAHYKTPLQIVIRKVFEMEKEAKKGGKNGFVICLIKRSGEERIATAKWRYENKDTIEMLKKIAKSFDEENEDGYLAKGFIQKFASEFKHLKDENGNFILTGEIITQEISRLCDRSYNLPKGIKISNKEKKKKEFIKKYLCEMTNLFWDVGGNIDNFINFCTITTFIHKGED